MISSRRLAVDVGGTFIDFVTLDPDTGAITIEKVRSAGALDEQFFAGTQKLGLDPADIDMIVHGSTMVINTIVQENGAK
ncbi:MAG: hydantoinase/oxoprolinase family protein, partial [Woeseia sp.]|nr:hydantoinase/oxoprolinase family protein [Woeseia sp.]